MASSRRCAASTSRSGPARCSRSSGRTAPARRPRSRSSRATATAAPARSPCSASRPRHGRSRVARADRDRPPAVPDAARAHRARDARALRRLLPRAARGRARRSITSGWASKADTRAGAPLRRTAAPARRRRRADRRPRPPLSRRADDRLRPLGAPPGLGGDRRPARPRQDRLPDHALHGRGAAARRPGRDHRARRDRRRGPPGRARRPRAPADDDQLPAPGRRLGERAAGDSRVPAAATTASWLSRPRTPGRAAQPRSPAGRWSARSTSRACRCGARPSRTSTSS